MRTKPNDSLNITLTNGISIKGSYQMSLGGLHISLYLINKNGMIIGSKNFGFKKESRDPAELLKAMTCGLKSFCDQIKFSAMMQERITDAVAQSLMKRFDKDLVFKTAQLAA